jgi:hypothetical protein
LTFTEMKERNENTLTLRGEREVWKPEG